MYSRAQMSQAISDVELRDLRWTVVTGRLYLAGKIGSY